jgi:hypothetical protein
MTLGSSVAHEILVTKDRVVFTFSGVVDDFEFCATANELRKILKDYPEINELVDYTKVERFDVSPSTVRTIAAAPPVFTGRSFQVFVAPETVVFGMSRMYQLLLQEKRPNMAVVRTLIEAEELLELMSDSGSNFEERQSGDGGKPRGE